MWSSSSLSSSPPSPPSSSTKTVANATRSSWLMQLFQLFLFFTSASTFGTEFSYAARTSVLRAAVLLRAGGPDGDEDCSMIPDVTTADTQQSTTSSNDDDYDGHDDHDDDDNNNNGKSSNKNHPFPVISRYVGGTWTNTYMIFQGIDFQRDDDRVRYVQWEIDGNECTVSLRTGLDQPPITLSGVHIGKGVVKFDTQGLPYEYLFRQIGDDTILVSRTEIGNDDNDENDNNNNKSSTSSRIDCGTIVLTGENTCLQTIIHMADGDLTMLEVIRGERKRQEE